VADDDDVRAYSVEVLRGLGYRVLEAHDGASALRPLERQEGRVDLLFSYGLRLMESAGDSLGLGMQIG
jgi:CheY-like chemotaxis protein